MKKVFLFAAVAAMMTACSSEQLTSNVENQLQAEGTPLNFTAYANRNVTRAGVPGDIDNANIGEIGFGVFAYYTAGEQYDTKATPNFMYNQKVEKAGDVWTYEPVKYWPNEFGDAAQSDDVDYLTFFAYAPWTEFEPTTGLPKVAEGLSAGAIDTLQNYNIISVNKNSATGDPIVKYAVCTDPAASVDLLWGVAAADADEHHIALGDNENEIEAGKPFIDLTKPNVGDSVKFNLRHALAKVKFTIDYDLDAETPTGHDLTIGDESRIYVRWIKIGGFAMKGALNLNNTEADTPLWKDFDGTRDLTFEDVTFFDGRKDNKEGTVNNIAKNELPQGLNPAIIEDAWTDGDYTTAGVTNEEQLLFGGDDAENNGFFYVIPRGQEEDVDITICYDVETKDEALAGKLADNKTHGSLIENVITKTGIFGEGIDFEAGKQYEVHIHLGMTSVKIEADVEEWVEGDGSPADPALPANQDED